MNLKRIIVIIILVISVILGIYLFTLSNDSKNEDISYKPNDKIEATNNKETVPVIDFLKSISGLKAKNIELIDSPVGIKGEFLAPRESILNGVDYFLKRTENDKMTNVKVDIGDSYIVIRVDYKITNSITTPIEIKVIPRLNNNKDLELKIKEVKFLDLKIADWIVNIGLKSFIKDWFPNDKQINIEFKEGVVIIYKDNFKGIYLDTLKVESTGLNINMTIDLDTIIKNINSKNK
ncbi:hypothetical protein [Romboutsia ilealis]|uniref:hypothetical protein n=1 Tax=Romboutsia ilealis TaxID=1115758 RepID=UPI002494EF4E|nr:hypothetical protein [Romboutsia ilealis]